MRRAVDGEEGDNPRSKYLVFEAFEFVFSTVVFEMRKDFLEYLH